LEIQDQLLRKISLVNNPKRIISLVPSQTEMLVDLGLESQLIGVTKFCIHPKNIRKTKMIVGGTKNVNFNKIKSLNPDFILCNKEENTAKMVDKLQKIAPTYVSDILNFQDFYNFSNDLGRIFGSNPNFINLNLRIQQKVTTFTKLIQASKIKNKRVAYLIWANPYMAVGNSNYIDFVLQLNQWKNIFSDKDRYPVIELNELKKADIVFLSSEPFPFKEKHKLEIKKHAKAKIICVDGEMFSWFGTRILKAFDYFTKLHK
jgi:ABC-type Fe3+-hydroxamate transport system substrate-binding protein